jgi:hypothetical protein
MPSAFGVIMRVNSPPNFPFRALRRPELNNLTMPMRPGCFHGEK